MARFFFHVSPPGVRCINRFTIMWMFWRVTSNSKAKSSYRTLGFSIRRRQMAKLRSAFAVGCARGDESLGMNGGFSLYAEIR